MALERNTKTTILENAIKEKIDNNGPTLIALLMCKFVTQTIIGHERGTYRVFAATGRPMDSLRIPNTFRTLFGGAAVSYFNGAYKSLILRDDKYIEASFDEMHNVCGHSHICLLNIVFKVYMTMHSQIDRTKLDTTCLASYQKSVETMIVPLAERFLTFYATMMNHECNGIDISTCDPDEPLFQLK